MNLSGLHLDEILDKYSFPQRLLAYFASQCAKDALSKIKKPDPRSIAAVDMAEAYGNGEDFTEEHKNQVTDDAYTANYAHAAHAAHAAYAAYAAAYITCVTATYGAADYAAHSRGNAADYSAHATAAARAAAYATQAIDRDYYKPLLLSLIESRLTKLEKILIFGVVV